MSLTVSPELAPHYYRDNFLALCDTVEAQYGDLLAAEEQLFLQRFRELEFRAQCLYVRLVSRVGPWFRESRLAYAELGPTGPLLDRLLDAGLVELAPALSLEELAGLCTRPELLDAVRPLLQGPLPRSKAALLEAIAELSLDDERLLDLVLAIDGERIVAPCGAAEVQVLQLLFFGNLRQGLTDFVLSDLGVARYYPYPLDRRHRLFPRREAVEEYLQFASIGDSWYLLRESGDVTLLAQLATAMLTLERQFPSSENRWHRLFNGAARDLERAGETALAGQLYARSGRHPARERRLRILERTGDWPAAAALGEEILARPWCEEERDAAGRVLPRVQRKLGAKPAARRRDDFARITLTLSPGTASVEQLAARDLEPHWASVHYVENSLMNTLFGLAFWEQIFAPVPGAFHNPFQSVPTDMYGPDFLERRRDAITARLAQLSEVDLGKVLPQSYRKYAPYQCRWVDWRGIDAAMVEAVANVVPGAHLIAIWERMLFDPRENRRGFPDLIALGSAPGDYSLIEIKGPGDALQESQKRWLRFFGRWDIPAAVAWVSWADQPDE